MRLFSRPTRWSGPNRPPQRVLARHGPQSPAVHRLYRTRPPAPAWTGPRRKARTAIFLPCGVQQATNTHSNDNKWMQFTSPTPTPRHEHDWACSSRTAPLPLTLRRSNEHRDDICRIRSSLPSRRPPLPQHPVVPFSLVPNTKRHGDCVFGCAGARATSRKSVPAKHTSLVMYTVELKRAQPCLTRLSIIILAASTTKAKHIGRT